MEQPPTVRLRVKKIYGEARDRLLSLAEKSHRLSSSHTSSQQHQRHSCYTPEASAAVPKMGLRAKDKAQRTSMYASEHSIPDKLSIALRALRPGALSHSTSSSGAFKAKHKGGGGAVVDADDVVFIASEKATPKTNPQHKYQKSPNTRKAKSVFTRNPSQSDLLNAVKEPTLKNLDQIRSLYKSVPNVNTYDDDFSYGESKAYRDDSSTEFSSSTRSPTDSGYRSSPRHLQEENIYAFDDQQQESSSLSVPKSTTVVELNGTVSSTGSHAGRSSRISDELNLRCRIGTPVSLHEASIRSQQKVSTTSLPFNERDVMAVLQGRRCRSFGHYLHSSIVPRMLELLAHPLSLLTDNVQRLCAYSVKCTVEEVITAVKLTLPLEVFASCLKTGLQATTIFALSGTGALKKSLSQRAELKFSVGKIHRWLIERLPNKPLADTTSVFFTAVLECLLEELVLRLVDTDTVDVLSLQSFEEIISKHSDLISFFSACDPLSRTKYTTPLTFSELIDAVHSIRQKIVMETEGSLSGKSRRRAQIQLSRSGIRSLHYFTCTPGAYRDGSIPLSDWVRLIYAYAEHRMSYTVDEVDVQQASRTLLHLDCPPPSVPLWRRELPPDVTPAEAKQVFAFSLISTGGLENIRHAVAMLEADKDACRNQFGLCALAEAVVQANGDAVQGLLSNGWNANSAVPLSNQDKRPFLLHEYTGWTPLTWAVAIQKHNLVKTLLHSSASVDSEEMIKDTPLQVAVQQGCVDSVRLLLDHGADAFKTTVVYDSMHADFRNAGCSSSIALAAARGNSQLIATLLAQLNEDKSSSLSMNDFLSGGKKLTDFVGRTDYESLTKEVRSALQEAVYYAVETSRPEIAVAIRNSVGGLPWNVYTWIRALETALERNDTALLETILKDFGPKLAAELTEHNIQQTLNVLFSIIRTCCSDEGGDPSDAAFTVSRLFHYFRESRSQESTSSTNPPASHRSVIDPTYVNNPQLSDIQFKVENNVIFGHRIVLVNASDKFRRLLQSPDGVVEISDVPHDIFLWMMQFVYTGRLVLGGTRDVGALFQLITAAESYGLPNLQTEAIRVLSGSIQKENFTDLYSFAIHHSMSALLDNCESFLLENFGSLISDRQLHTLVRNGSKSYDVSAALLKRLTTAFEDSRANKKNSIPRTQIEL